MPFCPSCRSEFQAGTAQCADCNVDLVDNQPEAEATASSDMVDVYVCYEAQQVERVLDVLRSAGLETLLRDRASQAFPTNVGHTAEKLVAVSGNDTGRARELLQAAIDDGVIPSDGEILKG